MTFGSLQVSLSSPPSADTDALEFGGIGIILGPHVLRWGYDTDYQVEQQTDSCCNTLSLSVVQLAPGGWDTGDETDRAKEILLWVCKCGFS